MGWVRVTVEDLETGEKESIDIKDTYLITCVGKCELTYTQASANGTHVLTVKNSNGEKRTVPVVQDVALAREIFDIDNYADEDD